MPAPVQFAPRTPRLALRRSSRWGEFRSSLEAWLTGLSVSVAKENSPVFRDAEISQSFPGGAMLASLCWHVAITLILILPIWHFASNRTRLAPVRIEANWYQPGDDLTPLVAPGPMAKPTVHNAAKRPKTRRGADAYHPRQTILSLPAVVTHPRQTLIQPDAPPEPPKIIPALPNIVQWPADPKSGSPKLKIDPASLRKMKAQRRRIRTAENVPLPDVPNGERNPGSINFAGAPLVNSAPQLPMAPASTPVIGPRRKADPGTAPEISSNQPNDTSGLNRLIALSATPAPPAPVAPPPGNLSARISISPEGKQPGTPGGTTGGTTTDTGGGSSTVPPAGTGNGNGGGSGTIGPAGISISGGNPGKTGSETGTGGPGGTKRNPPKLILPGTRIGPVIPERRGDPGGDAPEVSRMPMGAPEVILGSRQVYTLYVNMPNLVSVTGSWVLNFVEMETGDPPYVHPPGTLSGPVPVRKVDPRYPPALIAARVEGEVVLYAIIRKDGTVDSIQVLRGLDPQLDRNSMEALSRWRFRPAHRGSTPVELETVVHIPFRATPPQ